MKRKTSVAVLTIAGALLFNYIFWQEKLGINTLFFDLFICISVFWLFPKAFKNYFSKWLFAAHLIALVMLLYQNTLLSKFTLMITLTLFVIFSQYLHRTLILAGGSAALNFLYCIPQFFRRISSPAHRHFPARFFVRWLRILLVPAVLFCIFYIIYVSANSIFADISETIIHPFTIFIQHLIRLFEFERIGFFLLGMFITGGLIIHSGNSFFSLVDLKMKINLTRKRDRLKKWRASAFSYLSQVVFGSSARGNLALKNEYLIGALSVVLLNALLLFINFLDLRYVWFGFTYTTNVNLSSYVHEGAGLLIISIILAMAILLFFFRGNLNFYKQNKWLRYGAYAWILQNIFLVISVFLRNFYYISTLGLAYKRIGLLFFLALVISGLVTIFIKIYSAKTIYFLLGANSWVALFLLVFASCINWDEVIARYNLSRKSDIPVDAQFLLSLSDKTLPLLRDNADELLKDRHTFFYYNDLRFTGSALEFLREREIHFLAKQKEYSWLSWNASDAWVTHRMEKINVILSVR